MIVDGQATVVIKVGGEIATCADWLASVCADIAVLKQSGFAVILVHGGGPQLDLALRQRDRLAHRVAGRRVTSKEDLNLAIQVWRGELSTTWVQGLQKHGVMGVGLSGADGLLIQAHRRPIVSITDDDGGLTEVDFGYVGDIDNVNVAVLGALCGSFVPVVSPLAIDTDGQILNVNADTVAAAVASAVAADALVLLSSVSGLLRDVQDPSSRMARLELSDLPVLIKSGCVQGGMRPKLAALASAVEAGVGRAIILDGRRASVVRRVLIDGLQLGTEIVRIQSASSIEPSAIVDKWPFQSAQL